jgi:hypothetical protein
MKQIVQARRFVGRADLCFLGRADLCNTRDEGNSVDEQNGPPTNADKRRWNEKLR